MISARHRLSVGRQRRCVRPPTAESCWLTSGKNGAERPAPLSRARGGAAYLGVFRSLQLEASRPLATIDVGGRSTEIVIGDESGRILWKESFPLGAVRLTEECVSTDPVSPAEIATMREAAVRS